MFRIVREKIIYRDNLDFKQQTNNRQRQGRIPGPWRGGGGAGSALRVGAGVPPRLDGAVVAAP